MSKFSISMCSPTTARQVVAVINATVHTRVEAVQLRELLNHEYYDNYYVVHNSGMGAVVSLSSDPIDALNGMHGVRIEAPNTPLGRAWAKELEMLLLRGAC